MYTNIGCKLYNKQADSKDDNGTTIEGDYEYVTDINCDKQPMTKEIAIKAYGYNLPVEDQFYIDKILYPDVLIDVGSRFYIDDNKYEAKKVLSYDDHYEILTHLL